MVVPACYVFLGFPSPSVQTFNDSLSKDNCPHWCPHLMKNTMVAIECLYYIYHPGPTNYLIFIVKPFFFNIPAWPGHTEAVSRSHKGVVLTHPWQALWRYPQLYHGSMIWIQICTVFQREISKGFISFLAKRHKAIHQESRKMLTQVHVKNASWKEFCKAKNVSWEQSYKRTNTTNILFG